MTRRIIRKRSDRSGFGLALGLVIILTTILLILLVSNATSAMTLGRQQKLASLGSCARMHCNNALEEAFLDFLVTSNSPFPPPRSPADLFEWLREAALDERYEYEFSPRLSRQLPKKPLASISDVSIRLLVTNTKWDDDQPLWRPSPKWEPPEGWEETPDFAQAKGLAPEERMRAELIRPDRQLSWPGVDLSFDTPRVTAVGVVEFSVRCDVKGPYNVVSRTITVRKIFKLCHVARVELIPVDG